MTNRPPTGVYVRFSHAGAAQQNQKHPDVHAYAVSQQNTRHAQKPNSPMPPGLPSTRKPSLSQPKQHGQTPPVNSQQTSTASANAVNNQPKDIEEVFTAHPLGESSPLCAGSVPQAGARTLAEIGDPHRFTNADRLASHAGLIPIDQQSGSKTVARKPRGGNHRLKNASFTAAFTAIRHDPHARAYY